MLVYQFQHRRRWITIYQFQISSSIDWRTYLGIVNRVTIRMSATRIGQKPDSCKMSYASFAVRQNSCRRKCNYVIQTQIEIACKKTWSGGRNPFSVVVTHNKSENFRFYFFRSHFRCIDSVQLFFFQCRKKLPCK